MKIAKLLLLLSIVWPGKMQAADGKTQTVKTEAVSAAVHERTLEMYSYSTRLGELKFVREDGKPGEEARSITLNGKLLLSIMNEKDA